MRGAAVLDSLMWNRAGAPVVPPPEPGPLNTWPTPSGISWQIMIDALRPALTVGLGALVAVCTLLALAHALGAVITTVASSQRLRADTGRAGERWLAAGRAAGLRNRVVGGATIAGASLVGVVGLHDWDMSLMQEWAPAMIAVGGAAVIATGCSWAARRRTRHVPAAELHAPPIQTREALRKAGAALVHVRADSIVDVVEVPDGHGRNLFYRPTERTYLTDLPSATLARLDLESWPILSGDQRYLVDGRRYDPLPVADYDDGDPALSDIGDDHEWSGGEWSLSVAVEVHGTIKEAFAALSCDPAKVLTLPALFDNAEDSTAEFIESFADANGLEPADPGSCPPDHAARYVAAVQLCEETWEEAYQNAVDLGVQEYSTQDRGSIRRARLALDLALNPTTAAGERAAALAKARDLLEGIIELPEPLEVRIREAIAAPDAVPAIAQAR